MIAVGGQTVQCCDSRNRVLVDGQPLDEPYIYYLPEAGPARQNAFGPVVVPDGQLWMMGDSRNNSADSRVADHGPVPVDNVIGKARLIVLPFTRFGSIESVDPQSKAVGLPAPDPSGSGSTAARRWRWACSARCRWPPGGAGCGAARPTSMRSCPAARATLPGTAAEPARRRTGSRHPRCPPSAGCRGAAPCASCCRPSSARPGPSCAAPGPGPCRARSTGTGSGPVAGVDEAGRGACAGPLVVAACVLRPGRRQAAGRAHRLQAAHPGGPRGVLRADHAPGAGPRGGRRGLRRRWTGAGCTWPTSRACAGRWPGCPAAPATC